MKQQKDESGKAGIPVCAERENIQKWDIVRIAYASGRDLQNAHRSRIFLFSQEGQGYKNALSLSHNHARFRSAVKLLPPREKTQKWRAEQKEKEQKKKALIKALKYARKYNTLTPQLVERCVSAGISVKPSNRITLSNAEFIQRLKIRIGQE
jgi:hypothetical protein